VPCQNPRDSVTLGFTLDVHDRPLILLEGCRRGWRDLRLRVAGSLGLSARVTGSAVAAAGAGA
jgi:hypothetical protein